MDGFARRSGIAVELAVDAAVGRLPGAVELALFRVAQEGLGNVHRHAGSATARVALARDGDAVTLRVEDRGRGLPDAPEAEAACVAGRGHRRACASGCGTSAGTWRSRRATRARPSPPSSRCRTRRSADP